MTDLSQLKNCAFILVHFFYKTWLVTFIELFYTFSRDVGPCDRSTHFFWTYPRCFIWFRLGTADGIPRRVPFGVLQHRSRPSTSCSLSELVGCPVASDGHAVGGPHTTYCIFRSSLRCLCLYYHSISEWSLPSFITLPRVRTGQFPL